MSKNRREQSKEYSEEHILKFLGDSTFHRTCWDRTRKILMPDYHCDYFFPLGWCVLENPVSTQVIVEGKELRKHLIIEMNK